MKTKNQDGVDKREEAVVEWKSQEDFTVIAVPVNSDNVSRYTTRRVFR